MYRPSQRAAAWIRCIDTHARQKQLFCHLDIAQPDRAEQIVVRTRFSLSDLNYKK